MQDIHFVFNVNISDIVFLYLNERDQFIYQDFFNKKITKKIYHNRSFYDLSNDTICSLLFNSRVHFLCDGDLTKLTNVLLCEHETKVLINNILWIHDNKFSNEEIDYYYNFITDGKIEKQNKKYNWINIIYPRKDLKIKYNSDTLESVIKYKQPIIKSLRTKNNIPEKYTISNECCYKIGEIGSVKYYDKIRKSLKKHLGKKFHWNVFVYAIKYSFTELVKHILELGVIKKFNITPDIYDLSIRGENYKDIIDLIIKYDKKEYYNSDIDTTKQIFYTHLLQKCDSPDQVDYLIENKIIDVEYKLKQSDNYYDIFSVHIANCNVALLKKLLSVYKIPENILDYKNIFVHNIEILKLLTDNGVKFYPEFFVRHCERLDILDYVLENYDNEYFRSDHCDDDISTTLEHKIYNIDKLHCIYHLMIVANSNMVTEIIQFIIDKDVKVKNPEFIKQAFLSNSYDIVKLYLKQHVPCYYTIINSMYVTFNMTELEHYSNIIPTNHNDIDNDIDSETNTDEIARRMNHRLYQDTKDNDINSETTTDEIIRRMVQIKPKKKEEK